MLGGRVWAEHDQHHHRQLHKQGTTRTGASTNACSSIMHDQLHLEHSFRLGQRHCLNTLAERQLLVGHCSQQLPQLLVLLHHAQRYIHGPTPGQQQGSSTRQ